MRDTLPGALAGASSGRWSSPGPCSTYPGWDTAWARSHAWREEESGGSFVSGRDSDCGDIGSGFGDLVAGATDYIDVTAMRNKNDEPEQGGDGEGLLLCCLSGWYEQASSCRATAMSAVT